MANEINENGIVTDDLQTIIDDLTTAFKNIYGQDINLEQSTPDGQLINIFAQAKIDTLNLATQLYNIFNSETVVGRAQDNLYKLVGLYRKSSQFSFVQVNVTIDEPVNLSGLDDEIENINGVGYTVSDTNGNNFILSNSVNLTSAGTFLLEFRAQNVGAVQVLPNTIKNMVSVIRGVRSVNNPGIQYLTGNDEETDSEFRIRFNKSRSISGKGFGDSLLAALLNINLVSDAQVYQNRTHTTDEDGTAPHTVWCIVEGGTNEDVAQAIYSNVTDGAGMRGDVQVVVQKSNGMFQTIRFDRASSEPLYVRATLKNLTTENLDLDSIKEYLINNLNFKIYSQVDTAEITCILRSYSSDYIPYNVGVSIDNSSWKEYVTPDSKINKFSLSSENITLTVV
jgi:uncharacterized phage protein gp47/JayE